MSTDRRFDSLLRSWLDESAPTSQPEGLLESVLNATARTRPRPAWQVRLGGEPMAESHRLRLNRFAPLAVAGAAIVVAVLVGIGLLVRLSPDVGPSPLPGPTHDVTPTSEPASGRIVFGRYDRFVGDFVVYLIDPNGNNETQLLPGGHEGPHWSPDGKDIAMTSATSAGIFENAGQPGGSFREFTTFDGVRYLPDPTLNLGCTLWTPDGGRLACEGWDDSDPTRNGIYTVDAADGSDLQRLTSSPDGGHDIPGDYSADGSQLFFGRESGSIMVVGADGSNPHAVTSDVSGVPSLSPDGQTLVTASGGMLYIIAVDGTSETPIRIIGPTFQDVSGASWSPDGSWIVLSLATRPSDWNIARVRPDGSGLFQITDNTAEEQFVDWAP
jgi:Tol biopolymer transport system component